MLPDYDSMPPEALSQAEQLAQLGYRLIQAGAYEKAVEKLRASLALDHSLAFAHASLGAALAELKQLDEADRELNVALQLEPTNPAYLYLKGVLQFHRKNWKATAALMRQVLAIDPYYYLAFATLGDVLWWHLGQRKEGEAAVRKALELNPEDASLHRRLGRMLSWETMSSDVNFSAKKKQRRAEGQWHLAEALRIEPEDASSHHLLGTFAHNPTQKVEHLGESLRLNPLDKTAQSEFASARSIERDLRLHVWFWNLIAGRLPPHLRLPVSVVVGVGLLAGAMAFPSRSDAATICGLSFFLFLVYLRIAMIARPALVSQPQGQAAGDKGFIPPAHR